MNIELSEEEINSIIYAFNALQDTFYLSDNEEKLIERLVKIDKENKEVFK